MWSHLFDRPLWHDEEQIVFATTQLIKTGQRSYFDGKGIVGENLHHPLNDKWDLEVMSSGELWVARLGYWGANLFEAEHPWRFARMPFAFFGALTGFVIGFAVFQWCRSLACAVMATGIWFLIPWTWTVSVQLRYYPICFFFVALALYEWSKKNPSSIKMALIIVVMYLMNWVQAPFLLILIMAMDFLKAKEERLNWARALIFAVVPIVIHAFVLTNQGKAALDLPSRWDRILWVWKVHLAEFNLDVVPLLMIVLVGILGWKMVKMRPFIAASALVPCFLAVPSLYTRMTFFFLPLFVITFSLFAYYFSKKYALITLTMMSLWLGTHFFQSFPGIVLSTLTERGSRHLMPLNRNVESILDNPKKAWNTVLGPGDDSMDKLVDLVLKYTNEKDRIICASGGTGLPRRTGRTVSWKRSMKWGNDRTWPDWLELPGKIKMVIERRQWPMLSRNHSLGK